MRQYLCEICKAQIQGNMKTISDNKHELHFHEDCLLKCISKEAVIRYFWPIIDDVTVRRYRNELEK